MTLSAGQWSYRDLTFGIGTPFHVNSFEGLNGTVQRRSDRNIPRGHGGVSGAHFVEIRDLLFDLTVVGDVEGRLESLQTTFQVTEEPLELSFRRPDEDERFVFARPVAMNTKRSRPVGQQVRVAMIAADPRVYSSDLKTVQIDPFATGGGLDYPVDYPKDYTVTGLDRSATNGGNFGAPPLIRFFGPDSGTCTGVQLRNRTTGVTLDVQTDITSGQTLTVDMRAFVAATGGRVVDLSGANRYGSWQHPREPLLIEPGSNVLRFTADGTTAGMRAVVTFRDAYL